jgi:hypothetical protein
MSKRVMCTPAAQKQLKQSSLPSHHVKTRITYQCDAKRVSARVMKCLRIKLNLSRVVMMIAPRKWR